MLLARPSISIFISLFSFSSFCLTLCRLSTASAGHTVRACEERPPWPRAAAWALLQVPAHLLNSGLPLLVHLNLGGSGPAGFLQPPLISSSSRERSERQACFARRPGRSYPPPASMRAWRWGEAHCGQVLSSLVILSGWMRLTETMDLPVTP